MTNIAFKPNCTSKYDPDIHIPMLIDIMSQGKSVASFCVKAEIGRTSFNDWLAVNPDFEAAYDKAKALGVEWWEEWAHDRIDDPGFNMAFFKATMICRYNVCYEKKLKVKDFAQAKTMAQKMEKVAEVLDAGEHNQKEAKAIADIVAIIAQVEDKVETAEAIKQVKEHLGLP